MGVLNRVLVGIFIAHGVLYYIFPSMHYREDGVGGGWIALIKYVVAAVFVAQLMNSRNLSKRRIVLVIGLFAIASLSILVKAGFYSSAQIQLLFTFLLPAVFVLFPSERHIVFFRREGWWSRFIFVVFLINLFFCIFDMLLGGIFGDYSRSGFRAVGIFVNPNNTGIVAALGFIYIFYLSMGYWRKMLIVLLSLITLILTGSKTGMLMFLVGLLLIDLRWALLLLALGSFVLLVGYLLDIRVINIFEVFELRALDAESAGIRIFDWAVFYDRIISADFPSLFFGFDDVYLIDNSYLDLIAYGGLVYLLFFVVIQLSSIVCAARSSRLIFILMLMLFVSMLTTNTIRLWPVAYLYWILVGMAFATVSRANFLIKR